MGNMFPSFSNRNVIAGTWQKCSPCVKKSDLSDIAERCPGVTTGMLFGTYGRDALLVLHEKYYFGHMTRMFPSCSERNWISATWHTCYILVGNVTIHSARGRYIGDM